MYKIRTQAVKEECYNLDDISDQGHKDKLNQCLKDAVTVVAKLLDKMDDDAYKSKFEGWFGEEHSNDNSRELVRQVFKNFLGNNKDSTGAEVLGTVSVFQDDYCQKRGSSALVMERPLSAVGEGRQDRICILLQEWEDACDARM